MYFGRKRSNYNEGSCKITYCQLLKGLKRFNFKIIDYIISDFQNIKEEEAKKLKVFFNLVIQMHPYGRIYNSLELNLVS